MKILAFCILYVSVTFWSQLIYSQNDPSFTTFKGAAYGVPQDKLIEPFDSTMLDCRVMSKVSWKKMNFESDPCMGGIADLWLDENTYGIYLSSKMTIADNNCYRFSLNTDDGSYLWIDDDLIIDNSGDHKMTLKKQEVSLDSGTYDIRIWYYQLHDLCGFKFNAVNVNDETACTPVETMEEVKETFTLSSSVVFKSGSHIVKPSSHIEIKRILDIAKEQAINRIDIIGHTDNVGTEENNNVLSLKRAESIREIFNRYNVERSIDIFAFGKGEALPIDSNETEKGRARNRRVEILLIKE